MRKQNHIPYDPKTCPLVGFAAQSDHPTASWCMRHTCYVVECAICGRKFHTERPHTDTCSDRCRKRKARRSDPDQ